MINETGTFYLEGEYQQGDTILSAGDFTIIADIQGYAKYAVAYDENTDPAPSEPITLGNGNHKDFRYYPKALSANEIENLKA